jgi:hypothetical protein
MIPFWILDFRFWILDWRAAQLESLIPKSQITKA